MADKKYLTDSSRKTLTELLEVVVKLDESVHERFIGYAQAINDYQMFKEKGAAS